MDVARHPKTLSDFQKGQIEGRRESMSHAEIGRQLGIPRSTVTSFLSHFDDRNSMENLSHPDAPRKTTPATDRYIVCSAESETRAPLTELRIQTNSNVSEQTIRRRLREAGI